MYKNLEKKKKKKKKKSIKSCSYIDFFISSNNTNLVGNIPKNTMFEFYLTIFVIRNVMWNSSSEVFKYAIHESTFFKDGALENKKRKKRLKNFCLKVKINLKVTMEIESLILLSIVF